jgi:hypothetical protein
VKAVNARRALEIIQKLDPGVQTNLQSILGEFMKKEAEPAVVPAGLESELAGLQRKAAELSAELSQKKVALAAVKAAPGPEVAEVKAAVESAMAARDQVRRELEEVERENSEMKAQIAEWGKVAVVEEEGGETLAALEARLFVQKQKLHAVLGRTDTDDPRALDFAGRRKEIASLRSAADGLAREIGRKKTEADALRGALAQQNQRASVVMLKRIAQLNAEMDQSPLGEARRAGFKYRKLIQKLRVEIDTGEREAGEAELGALEKEVQLMAERKASESDLLAKKLSFMQATAEQCGIRLQRMKVHVELQMHNSRLKRWKSCFAEPPPQTA